MGHKIRLATLLVLIIHLVFLLFTKLYGGDLYFALSVTSGTILYHIFIRIIVGDFVPKSFKYNSWWFVERRFEKGLYKAIGVKKWKGKMPTYDPAGYALSNDYEAIANMMCRNEIVHEINMLLSFIPILFSIYVGKPIVFVITSIIAALVDSVFVIMQRYNRPRLVKIINRRKKNGR